MEYPTTRRDDVVETLHGHRIADPYRWLEDPDSPETQAWVSAQNALTHAHLRDLPGHERWSALMREIVLRPVVGVPVHEHGWYLVSRNDGTRPQNTWYVARTLEELEAGGRVLLDPSSWSADGTASLAGLSTTGDGGLLAYTVSEGGSDWQHVRFLDPETGADVEDEGGAEIVTKFGALVWLPDHRTFLYRRYGDARAEGTATTALPRPVLMAHTFGTPKKEDRVVLDVPEDPRLDMWPEASSDGRWIVVPMNHGADDAFAVRVHRASGSTLDEPLDVLPEFRDHVEVVDVVGDVLYVVTDADAPRGRVARLDLAAFERGEDPAWETVVPEGEDALQGAVVAGDVLLTHHLRDASPVLTRYDLDGHRLGALDLDAGSVLSLQGEAGRDELLVSVNSVTAPVQSFVVTPSTGAMRELSFLDGDGWTPPQVTVTRHRAASADGTRVPYWLLRRADLPVDGPVPTLMYGYGGFNIPIGASFSAMNAGWLTAGGAVAIANLRGGGEFGTEWYEQGTRSHKQNVFDDFAAVGQHLVTTGVTTPDHLAAYGGSNGGLLVGALLTQHPELVAAAVPMVGVLDLLRFHRFTIGAAWISDYGDPDVAEDFEVALAYSPLHRIREGERYPATLVVTGDHDDRVVPAHSHKFTATLQRAQGGDAPILTRIETSTGHGAGKPRAVAAQEAADMLTFLAHHTGLTPPE
ncbi:prolyl oligopeptidase family serine peptidase [Mobilicoccus pelagius]|uniref:prolyl oligopeptidase n=1 Tax=Mobilicoccus pelagius NBRC 104925 TaxID=1089455 RepID=H5UNC8_9MICO|nr:prolyl oligopeptidase family serine peptidase [Mobilicoccus pelagius]GAB47236.1 putative prolyl endopeptidase [Mobilicoccus pelagius NBRC 104925]